MQCHFCPLHPIHKPDLPRPMLIPNAGGGWRVGAIHSVVTLETEESGTKLLGLLESEAGWLWALVGFCT